MGICRKLITGVFLLVVSLAAWAVVRVNQRSGCPVFKAVSCPEISIYFSEWAMIGLFKELNGCENNFIVPVKLFYTGTVQPKPPCG